MNSEPISTRRAAFRRGLFRRLSRGIALGALAPALFAPGLSCNGEKTADATPVVSLVEAGQTVIMLREGARWEYTVENPGDPSAAVRKVSYTLGKPDDKASFPVRVDGDDDVRAFRFIREGEDIFFEIVTAAGTFRPACLRWRPGGKTRSGWSWKGGNARVLGQVEEVIDPFTGKEPAWKVEVRVGDMKRVYYFTSSIGVRREERYEGDRVVWRATLSGSKRPGVSAGASD